MDGGPPELDLAVEAAWILGGRCIAQDLLDVLLSAKPGGCAEAEGLVFERVAGITPAARSRTHAGTTGRWRQLGLATGWETLGEAGERLQKARIRRELLIGEPGDAVDRFLRGLP